VPGATSIFLGWSTPDVATGWQENFSTELYINRVRVFAHGGDFEQGMDTYVVPSTISFSGRECRPAGDGSITNESCPLGGVTPTNFHTEPHTKVVWDVEIDPSQYDKRASYYIEFVVGVAPNPGGLTAGVGDARLTPSSIAFGNVDTWGTASRKLFLENNGTGKVDVSSVTVNGPFTITSSSVAINRPFSVAPSDSVILEVVATGVPVGDFMGSVELAIDGEPEPLVAVFHGEGYYWGPGSAAGVLGVNLLLGDSSVRRRFLVAVNGYNDVRVASLVLAGPGADEVAVSWERASTDPPCPSPDDPQCLNRPMAPGTAAIYRIDRVDADCVTDWIDASISVELEECVTQPAAGATCGPGDDWRPAGSTTLPIMITPGFCGH
jgi:hypothetical protein